MPCSGCILPVFSMPVLVMAVLSLITIYYRCDGQGGDGQQWRPGSPLLAVAPPCGPRPLQCNGRHRNDQARRKGQ